MGRQHRVLRRQKRRRRRLSRHIEDSDSDSCPNLVAISDSEYSDSDSESEESSYESESEGGCCKHDHVFKAAVLRCTVVNIKAECENKGGKRNTKTYAQKAECLDDSAVLDFLQNIRCTCQKKCLHKLASLGKKGFRACK